MGNIADDTQWLDATAQAELVARGEVSSTELVDAAAERIERSDGPINAVVLRWDPGIDSEDPTLASPEFHRSDFTGQYDFQGYRIYRIQGGVVTGDPFEQASLLAEFDRTEWPDGTPDTEGFNVTGWTSRCMR